VSKPLPFTAFVRDVLRVRLTPGQRVLCLVAYDGVGPRQLEGEDRELARRIFGDVEVVPEDARQVFVAVCGARGGKSYILCGLRLLHLALTVPLHTLAPGEMGSALIVAPDLRLARQTLRYALGAAKTSADITRRIVNESADGFILRRENGAQVSVECLPATRGGSALRGRSLLGAVLDESAFFRDEDYSVNDAELFKAVSPRILPEGQAILASTPWAEGIGLLHSLFAENHGAPRHALAAHAPTLLLRDDARTRAMVERERDRDADNAAREFDAVFMSAGAGLFFDPRAIDKAVDRLADDPQPHLASSVVAVGADFGFRSDASALVVARLEGDVYRIADLRELRPQKGAPLQPSVVVSSFAEVARSYGATSVVADRHYEEAVREHLATHALRLVPAPDGLAGKVEVYTRTRALIHEGRVRLPPNARLLAQLKAVTSKPTSGGSLTISSPRRAGAHGDLASAFVLALASLPSAQIAPWMRGRLVEGQPLFGGVKAAA
jgi:hypothetical protein